MTRAVDFRQGRARSSAALSAFAILVAQSAHGEDPRGGNRPSFERDVMPILSAACVKCHGGAKPKANLDLRTKSGIDKGSENGPVVVRGAAKESVLFDLISSGKMPPGKNKLSNAQVNTIGRWIDAGAPTGHATRPVADSGTSSPEHWSFRPPAHPRVPAVRHTDRVRTEIDAFLLAALENKGLSFSPDADKVTLIRRAKLDLLGVPPSPEDVDAFLVDHRPGSYERLLERLLASPQFGERWGRHWLDVVGYADTVGFDDSANEPHLSQGKWRYRDYVIAAFNKDKPYDRFVLEQLAGDELVDWRNAPQFTPEIRELLIATGYLRTARDNTHEPESNIPLSHFGVLHDTVSIIGNSLLGMTVGCAQCHDHKFDPITQQDYYGLMAALTPAYNPANWKPVYPWKPDVKDRGLPEVSPAEKAEIDRHNTEIDKRVGELRKEREAVHGRCSEALRHAKIQKLPEPIRGDAKAAFDKPAEKRNEIERYLVAKLQASIQVTPAEVAAALAPNEKTAICEIDARIAAAEAQRRKTGRIQALYDVGPPPSTHLLVRGNFETPGPEVQPGFLHALCNSPSESSRTNPARPAGATSGRRLALGYWLIQPETRASALLARVMANRIWQHLFGRGIVPSAENLGVGGEQPTHHELLEWLSSRLARSGWEIKPLIKLIMNSTAYRQASRRPREGTAAATAYAAAEKLDAADILLWRMRLRRLEAEAIRDEILSVSGRLDATFGGAPILLHAADDGSVDIDKKSLPYPAARGRRSVYVLFRRTYNLSMLTVFDQPAVAINCPSRDVSAVPLQPLTMLNDSFVADAAKQFAERVERAGVKTAGEAVRAAFRIALAREPDAAEEKICAQLLERQALVYRAQAQGEASARHHAVVELCHTLLNTSEFLYVE
jgi:hypothetical protein